MKAPNIVRGKKKAKKAVKKESILVGDVVVLKNGLKNRMTVTGITKSLLNGKVVDLTICDYFEGSILKRGTYTTNMLKRA